MGVRAHRLVLADAAFAADRETIERLLPPGRFEARIPERDGSGALPYLLTDAEYLITRSQPVTASILQFASRLRMVQQDGERADGIDLAAARVRGVVVAVLPPTGGVREERLRALLANIARHADGEEPLHRLV